MILSVIVILSCLNSINATMVFGARSNFAMGQDFRTFSWLGRWHGSGNPRNSLILQMFASLAVVSFAAMTGQGFEAVVEFTAPVFWAFVLLIGVALFILRRKYPHLHRPYKVPLYPWLPLVFIAHWSSLQSPPGCCGRAWPIPGWVTWSVQLYSLVGCCRWPGMAYGIRNPKKLNTLK